MVEIKSKYDLEVWLEDKPRAVSLLMAARAALRVIPAFSSAHGGKQEKSSDVSLAGFRADAIAWAAAVGYEREAAIAAADAAYAAADAVYTAAYAADAGSAAAIWETISLDASLWDGDLAAFEQAIAAAPLFRIRPEDMREGKWEATAWPEFRQILEEDDKNWQVWIDWYDDRFHGRPNNPAFETALLSPTEEEGKRPVAEVNARLTERKSEFEQKEVVAEDQSADDLSDSIEETDQVGSDRFEATPQRPAVFVYEVEAKKERSRNSIQVGID